MEKEMSGEQEYKYFAFISYNSRDAKWGRRLQRKLEGYRMPATLCSEHGWQRTPLRPVFFAPTDIQPGGLSEELQERLRASRNLIVICSPHSAQSEWVGREIAYFHSLGRGDHIHFLIVDGVPHSGDPATECFNPVVETLGLPEILGANIHEKVYKRPWLNRERAYVQLITKLLGVEFDSIWQRHRRLRRQKIAAITTACVLVVAAIAGVWRHNQPVDVRVGLSELSAPNDSLPSLGDAIVRLTIAGETKSDTVALVGGEAVFANIPRSAIGRDARIEVSCPDALDVDTVVRLAESTQVGVRRDDRPYGEVVFMLWSTGAECGVPHTRVRVGDIDTVSDGEGYVRLSIPPDRQRRRYRVECERALESDVLAMPTTTSTVLVVKE